MATLIAWGALAIAVVALGLVWKLSSELATATRRLDRYNKALFDASDEIRHLREGLEQDLAHMRVQLRQQQGVAFTPEMTVREVLMTHPQAEQVLATFHLGGCSHCAVEPGDRLADACREHGVDLQMLVGNLNLLMPGRQHVEDGISAPQLVKLPNVALEFE
jgi:hybrid cluster-associated redox disulfide protein